MLKKLLFGLGLSLELLLAGCHAVGRPADCVLLNSDFEQFEGWVQPLPAFLVTDQAHSGRYALRLAAGAEFGPAYHTPLGRCAFVPRRLHLSAWVYAPSGRIRSTILVTEVNCQGRRPNVWVGFELETVVKRYQKWEFVQSTIKLPADLLPDDEVKVYLWHPEASGERLWLDDIKLIGEKS